MRSGHIIPLVVMGLLGTFAMVAKADPMKELGVYKGNLGKWACDATETGSGNKFKATVEHTVEFDGNTYIERYTEAANADHPTPWKGIFIMSYDPETKRWVRNGVDNSGVRNAASSSGWNGDTWVWENEGANIVISKKSPNARLFTFAIDVKDGSNVKRVVEASCSRR